MTTYFPISLSLDAAQEKELLQLHESLGKLLEKAQPIAHPPHEAIKQQLSSILHAQPAWAACMADPYTQRVLALQHPDSRILNLPWELALAGQERLYLSKNTLAPGPNYVPDNPLPLKILVMVSCPEDSSVSSRLSFEEEELAILRACGNLFETGQVQIDFTEDGSLANLRQKLKDNHYHILHFSGHGVFHQGTGYLELEDEFNQQRQLGTAQDFAAALSATPEHLPALVLLSSCQSAQAGQDNDFSGVAQELLRAKVPAVVAMGWSILDRYANGFAEVFYQALADREALPQAFQKAILNIQQQQNQELALAQTPGLASQWFIPQLYMAGPLDKIANLEKGEKKLNINPVDFAMKDHPTGYYFVGRRRDKRTLLPALFAQQPIWLQGQGGLGKSSLAEHLVQRLLAKDGAIQPFVLDENSMDLLALRSMLYTYFKKEHKRLTIEIDTQRYSEKAPEQVLWLLTELSKVCKPLFVFDNLESLQVAEGNPEFAEQHRELQELLHTLTSNRLGYLIFTGRYPAPAALATSVLQYSLKMVSFGDFWKKTQQLRLVTLRQSLLLQQKNEPANTTQLASYEDLIQWLYSTFGGNYRALEFFDEYFSQNPNKISQLLDDLDQFPQLYALETEETLQRMSTNLVFERLLTLLTPLEQQTLGYLQYYVSPVLPLALSMQNSSFEYDSPLKRLLDLTLIEEYFQRETEDLKVYYVPPLVQNLLREINFEPCLFSQIRAGEYFEYMAKDVSKYNVMDFEQAFFHYFEGGDAYKINMIGSILSSGFSQENMFSASLHYSLQILLKVPLTELSLTVVNNIASAYKMLGDLENGLKYYKLSLTICENSNNTIGKGGALNHIGQIYRRLFQYDLALEFLFQSLEIKRLTKDSKGESQVMSNIGLVFLNLSDFDKATEYIEKSIILSEDIGYEDGVGPPIISLSSFLIYQGKYEKVVELCERALAIAVKNKSKEGESVCLNMLGLTFIYQKNSSKGIKYLSRALVIQKEIEDIQGEACTYNNLGLAYMELKDCRLAEEYFLKSEGLARDINDKKGYSDTLLNLGQLASDTQNFPKALQYLDECLEIKRDIKDLMGKGVGFDLKGEIYAHQGLSELAIKCFEKSIEIFRQVKISAGELKSVNNMVNVFKKENNLEKMLEFNLRRLEIAQEIGIGKEVALAHNDIGAIFMMKQKPLDAINYFNIGAKLFLEMNDQLNYCISIHNIATINLQAGKEEEFLKIEMIAYEIALDIDVPYVIFEISFPLGYVLCKNSDTKPLGMQILRKALDLGRKNHLPGVDSLSQMIDSLMS